MGIIRAVRRGLRFYWSLVRDKGTAADGICAICGVMVTPEGRMDDPMLGDTYCGETHFHAGIAARSW
jgi:hypothetical protein